jgi:hypothetical protein
MGDLTTCDFSWGGFVCRFTADTHVLKSTGLPFIRVLDANTSTPYYLRVDKWYPTNPPRPSAMCLVDKDQTTSEALDNVIDAAILSMNTPTHKASFELVDGFEVVSRPLTTQEVQPLLRGPDLILYACVGLDDLIHRTSSGLRDFLYDMCFAKSTTWSKHLEMFVVGHFTPDKLRFPLGGVILQLVFKDLRGL